MSDKIKWSKHDYGNDWLINNTDGGIYCPKWLISSRQATQITNTLNGNVRFKGTIKRLKDEIEFWRGKR